MTKRPSWQLAICGAGIIEGFVFAMVRCFGDIEGDGPNFWGAVAIVTMFPGAVIGESLFGVTSPMVSVFGFVSGTVEFFLVLWAALAFVKDLVHPVSVEPGVAPNGGPVKQPGNPGGAGRPPSVS